MRRLLLAALLLAGQRASAQALPDSLTAQPRHEARYRALDPARIPTGVLLDRTVPFSAVRRLDGTRDTATTYGQWRQMYLEFWNATLRRELLTAPADVDRQVYQGPSFPGLPLRVLHYRYNQLRPDAEALGRVWYDSVANRLRDVPGTESPYVVRRALAIGVPPRSVSRTTVPFYLGRDQIFGNVAPDSATIRIDFGDGQGTRVVALGQTVTIEYPSAGEKLIRLSWVQNGHTYQAATSLRVSVLPDPDRVVKVVATDYWPGQSEFGRASVYVAAGVGNPKVWENGQWVQKIRKPLVFVEGIDFGSHGSNPADSVVWGYWNNGAPVYPYKYGFAGWALMQEYDEEYKSLEKLPAMRQRLQDLGYDVMYFDFNDGEALIEQNAMALVQLLRWLRDPANRTGSANNEVVVMGASMGGQVARFALTWMEQHNEPTCGSLYVSFDSPHYGANIPIGLQHMIHDLSSLFYLPDRATATDRNKLRSPAAQQMLRLHFDATNTVTSLGNAWANWQLNPANWPTRLRKVAVANGAKNRINQHVGPSQTLLETSTAGSILLGTKRAYTIDGVTITRNFQPDKHNVVYLDRNGLTGSGHFEHVPDNFPGWDHAPGCTYQLARTMWDAGRTVFDHGSIKDNCFMPTVSTLGVHTAMQGQNGGDFWYDIHGQLPDPHRPDPTRYRFDAYYAALDDNEPHVQITDGTGQYSGSNNSEWIIQELREAEATVPSVLAAGTSNTIELLLAES